MADRQHSLRDEVPADIWLADRGADCLMHPAGSPLAHRGFDRNVGQR